MADIYDAYKPLRNAARRCQVLPSLIDVWALANHIRNNGLAPTEPGARPYSLHDYLLPWDLPVLVREVVINGMGGRGDRLNSVAKIRKLVAPMRELESVCTRHRMPRRSDDVFQEMVRVSHRQFPWQQYRLEKSLPRYLKIFGSPEVGPILTRETGLTVQQFFFLGFALAGHLRGRFDINASTDYSVFHIDPATARAFFGRFTLTLADLRKALLAGQHLDETWELAWNELENKPLIAVDPLRPERVICPIPDLLLRRFSGGLYYDLCRSKGFADAIGDSFANYVGEVLAAGFTSPRFQVLKEQVYQVGKKVDHHGADWIVVGPDANLFVECKAKRLSLQAKIAAGALLEEQIAHIADAVVQTYKNIGEAEAGKTPHWQPNVLPTLPLVVMMEEWFLWGPELKDMVERSVLKLLMDEGMDTTLITSKPYSVMSMQELEICVGPMAEVGVKNFISGRSEGEYGIWMWAEYVIKKFPQAQHVDFRRIFGKDWQAIIPEDMREQFWAFSGQRKQ